MLQTKVTEKIKNHFSCLVTFLFENRAFYEIMQYSVVEPEGPQMTI